MKLNRFDSSHRQPTCGLTRSLLTAAALVGAPLMTAHAEVIDLNGIGAAAPPREYSSGPGNGADGLLAVSGIFEAGTVRAALPVTAAAASSALAVSTVSGFAAGQRIGIIQMTGLKAGQVEEGVIVSVGTGALQLLQPLRQTYPVSVTDAAQVLVIPQYTDLTIQPYGTLTCPAWDGSTGGVLWIKVAGTLLNNGTVDVTGKGFVGGAASAGGAGGTGGAGGVAGLPFGAGAPGTGGAIPGGGEGAGGGAAGGGAGAVGLPGMDTLGASAGAPVSAGIPLLRGGAGGDGGRSGGGSSGAGGGGGGRSTHGGSGGSTAGAAGALGAAGGTSGAGGTGGGLTFIEVHRPAGNGAFLANGTKGENGLAGQPGLPGGAGGRGSNGIFSSSNHPPFPPQTIAFAPGGGGGGGRGGRGGDGGGGGNGGAGGFNLIRANLNDFTGTLASRGGAAALGGAGGDGGPGGAAGAGGTAGGGFPAAAAGQPGPAGVSGTAAPAGSVGSAGMISLQLAPEQYSFWQARHFSLAELSVPALSAATADTDSDSISNLLEFAFNLDPRSADYHELLIESGLPATTMEETPTGPRLMVVFLRRKASSLPGISCHAIFSTDLSSTAWEPAASEVLTSIDETWERVVATDPAPAGTPRRFARVSVCGVP